ncbi:hypothetical protein BDN70DRAFT_887344 [Pholiota conissans]|uniref:Ubiquitin-like domain-containing protein n=1 Tax=Pholiota conissans TaxID=109636 RepID=A0A9P6CSI2_9AGAR|nr:hypothetical protein BDN70DRAFT_887344 [Pholiota conissans]
MLSEKAKGKQRAVEPPFSDASVHSSAPPPPEETSRDLVVRFTEGAPDLTITVDKKDSVRDVKKNIRDTRPELHNRRLRLIHSGRLLTDGTYLFSWLTSLEERQQRANTTDAETPGAATAVSTATPAKAGNTTWIHCSVGPVMDPSELEDDTNVQTAQLQPARGFDRLASVGFSPEDIENFRRQFHSQSSSNYLDVDFETEEEYDEHARALEEQWIDNIDNAGSATLSQSSSANSTMLQGVLLGFFFPFLPFFFLRGQKPAVFWADDSEQEATSNVIFSRRMSMGIIVGFLVNILFGLWRFLLDSS